LMKLFVKGWIQSRRVINTWKEGKTILWHKKRDREESSTWRPISVTNCMYRILTCLMGRAIQNIPHQSWYLLGQSEGFYQENEQMQRTCDDCEWIAS
jgi:hypothetical protein